MVRVDESNAYPKLGQAGSSQELSSFINTANASVSMKVNDQNRLIFRLPSHRLCNLCKLSVCDHVKR